VFRKEAGMENQPPPLPPEEPTSGGEPAPGVSSEPTTTGQTAVFTGSGREYFRIWIVNLCLSLVTLGLYIPWARVRTRRYFYRNTLLAGHAFDYLADPKRLLVGYLIVGVLFLVYILGDIISIWITLGALLVFFLAFPFIRYKSLRFFARNSAYQNVRLRFHGTLKDAYRIYLGMMLFLPVTLGLLYPYIAHQGNRYLFGNLAFGRATGVFTAHWQKFYQIYFVATGIFVAAIGLLMAVFAALFFYATTQELTSRYQEQPEVEWTVAESSGLEEDDERKHQPAAVPDLTEDDEEEGSLPPGANIAIALGATSFYLIPLLVFLGAGVAIRNVCWNHFRVRIREGEGGPEVTFRSRMKIFPYLGIHLTNLLLIVVTLGMFLPWAKVRLHRYRLRCLEVFGVEYLAGVSADVDVDQSAVGDSASDLFDLEFGL
jgi:uncharacterized membrane protein YjgN (DUF898 family)